MAMKPYERTLVQRLGDKHFAIVGVNNDQDRDVLKTVQERKQISWRSFWDGPVGDIATLWGVEGFPTLYLLDTKGIIRFHLDGMPRDLDILDRAIMKAMNESAKDGDRKG